MKKIILFLVLSLFLLFRIDICFAAMENNNAVVEANTLSIKTAVEIMDDWDDANYCNVNLNIGGTDVSANAGANTAQTLRVTIATDDEVNNDISAIKTATELLDDTVYVDDADWTGDTSKHVLVGGLYGSNTITDGDVGPISLAADGAVNIDDGGNSITVDDGGTDLNVEVTETEFDSNITKVSGSAINTNGGNRDAQTITVTLADNDPATVAVEIMDDWDDANYCNVNLNIMGTDVSANAGVNTAQTQRVTIATDDEINNDISAIKTAAELLDDTVYVDDADWTGDTSKHILVGGLYGTNTITDGDVGPISLAADGAVNIDDGGNSITVDDGGVDINVEVTETEFDSNITKVAGSAINTNGGNRDAQTITVTLADNDPATVALEKIDDWEGAGNYADYLKSAAYVDNAGSPVIMNGDADGDVQVDILSVAAGDNNIGNVDIVTLPAGNLGQQAITASLSVVPANNITDTTYIGDIKFGESLPAGTNNIGDVDQVTQGRSAARKETSQDLSSAALAYTTNFAAKTIIKSIMVHASVPITETITISFNSLTGANYDTVLVTQGLVAESNLFYLPPGELILLSGDEIDIACTNVNVTGTVYVTVIGEAIN